MSCTRSLITSRSNDRIGKPITAYQLSTVLAQFGIGPKTLRIGTERAKGYELVDFADAFSRYLPGEFAGL